MDESNRTELTFEHIMQGATHDGLLNNCSFMPSDSAGPALHALNARVMLMESPILCDGDVLSGAQVANTKADRFPQLELTLVSDGEHLIPIERVLLQKSSGCSFWDLVVSPGRVWSEPSDDGMSRAVLPFQLCNELENDTHHGLACFLFDDEQMSAWQFQIVVETKPFLIPDSFDGWGVINIEREAIAAQDSSSVVRAYRREMLAQHSLQSMSHLSGAVPAELLDALEVGFGSDTAVVHGLIIDDVIYASPCRTRAGDYPLPRAMMLGLWSATKTAFGTLACMRLAQREGEDCRAARVFDLLPEARTNTAWTEITIGDCLNMATGIGTAGTEPEPSNAFADYLLTEPERAESKVNARSYDHYFDWFLAYPKADKNKHAFECPSYPWPAGQVARYRDQDLYIAGAAMDAWFKRKTGPEGRLWDMLRSEVYEPCGIGHAVKFHTREVDPKDSVPLTDAGLLLSIDHVASLARLLHDGGCAHGEQLLDRAIMREVFDPTRCKGLATGTYTTDGEKYYHCGTWHLPFQQSGGELFWLPTMMGYGGQMIQLLPNGMTAFRFAHDSYASEERYDGLKLARVADALTAFAK